MDSIEGKIKEVVAQHTDQIEAVVENKIEEVLDSKTDEIKSELDKIENKVESAIETIGNDIEKKVDELPEPIKNVLELVESNLADVVDGRVISCSLFGFLWTLRITRKSPQSSPSKSEESLNKAKSQPSLSIRIPGLPQSSSAQ